YDITRLVEQFDHCTCGVGWDIEGDVPGPVGLVRSGDGLDANGGGVVHGDPDRRDGRMDGAEHTPSGAALLRAELRVTELGPAGHLEPRSLVKGRARRSRVPPLAVRDTASVQLLSRPVHPLCDQDHTGSVSGL